MSSNVAPRIGIVGCGPVGQQIGVLALEAGLGVAVRDRHRDKCALLVERGASFAESDDELLARTDLLFTALPGDDDVRAYFLDAPGVGRIARSDAVAIDLSTTSPETMREIGEALAGASATFLDGALGLSGDEEGTPRLHVWIGGRPSDYAALLPHLERMSLRSMFCGGVGQAQILKLTNNVIAHSQILVIVEALTVAVRAGIPFDVLLPALARGTAHSRMLHEVLARGLFRGDFTPGLKLSKATEELRTFSRLAAENDAPLEQIARTLETFEDGLAAGLGERSCHAVATLHEVRTGTELRLGSSQKSRGAPPRPGPHD